MFSSHGKIGYLKDLAFFLYSSSSVNAGYFFLCALFLFAASNLFLKLRYLSFLFDVFIWWLVVNIHNKLYLTLTAGDFLLNQFLLFNCFLSKGNAASDKLRPLQVLLHNLGIIAIIAQMCLAYFMSGIAKIMDADWLSGQAIIHTLQVKHYTMYSLVTYNTNLDFIYKTINYFVILYQLTFSVVIWIPRLKKPMLLIGIVMHLYIAFVMGLVTFGLVMLLGYIYFWPSKKYVQ